MYVRGCVTGHIPIRFPPTTGQHVAWCVHMSMWLRMCACMHELQVAKHILSVCYFWHAHPWSYKHSHTYIKTYVHLHTCVHPCAMWVRNISGNLMYVSWYTHAVTCMWYSQHVHMHSCMDVCGCSLCAGYIICMWVLIHTYIHALSHFKSYLWMHTHMHAYMHTYTQHTHTRLQFHSSNTISKCMLTCIHTHIHAAS